MERKLTTEISIKTVLVFKTSVNYKKQIKLLAESLDQIGNWNFDLEDCDHILRVETTINRKNKIIALLQEHGLKCEELE